MHLELLNIGHTSPATVPTSERASCKHSLHTKSSIIWVLIYGLLNLSINSAWQNAVHKKKYLIWATTTKHGLACATYRMHLDHQYFTAAWVPWVTNLPRCEKAFIAPPLKLFSVRYVVATPHNCEVVNDHLEPVQKNDRAKKRRRREEDGSVDWERARTGREAINTAIRMRRWWRLAWDSVTKLLFPRCVTSVPLQFVAAVHLQMSRCEMLCNCKRSHVVDQMSTNLLRDTQRTPIHRNRVHRI